MTKNCVFKPSVSTQKWLKAAAVRAIKTMAQTAIPMIPVGVSIDQVSWMTVAGVVLSAGILSIVTSISGIPEVESEE